MNFQKDLLKNMNHLKKFKTWADFKNIIKKQTKRQH